MGVVLGVEVLPSEVQLSHTFRRHTQCIFQSPTKPQLMPSLTSTPQQRSARPSPALKLLNALCDSLRARSIAGPDAVAIATAKALRTVVQAARGGDAEDLAYEVKRAGKMLQDAQPAGECCSAVLRDCGDGLMSHS